MIQFRTDAHYVALSPNQEVAITLENPLFQSDRIPIAWTTNIEAPLSGDNKFIFGYSDSMLLPIRCKTRNAEMLLDGIPVAYGKLKTDGAVKGNCIKVSFSGATIEDSLSGALKDAKFAKWNFGKLRPGDSRALYTEIMTSAGLNTRQDFATPLMIRESQKDNPDVYSVDAAENPEEFFATKYLNSPKGNFIIPVVKLKYILNTVFTDCKIDNVFASYIDKIGIVAPYRKNGNLADYKIGCLDKDADGNFILDLSEAMPNVTIEDFVKNLLTTFCATIFIDKDGKTMRSNQSIITSSEFIDWTPKVDDNIEQSIEDGQNYEYGFSSVTETDIPATITNCLSIGECFAMTSGSYVRCSDTGDIYGVIDRKIIAGHGGGEYYKKGLTIKMQEAMLPLEPNGNSTETFSSTSNFIPVKSIPYRFFYSIGLTEWTVSVMVPIVEIPVVGGTRPDAIQFGTLEEGFVSDFANQVQFTSNGCRSLGGSFWSGPSIDSLSMRGLKGIYERFHRDFKEWISKDKNIVTAPVNLSAMDIANLQLWRKIMLYNQLFFIRKLSVTANTSKDGIKTDGEFIVA